MLQNKDKTAARVDGRRTRGADNRRRIVDALCKLVERGNAMPSAEGVAAEAGVGLRTVFRHFADMETLYAEISERMMAEIRPIIARPFVSNDWRKQVAELLDRRALAFERILPFKIAGDAHRAGSAFLTTEQKALVKMQREALRLALPAKIADDRTRLDALDLVTSLDTWRRLRSDQGLSVRDARAAVRLAVEALTSSSLGT
jgi:AcrR family transcriptional regulator